MERIEDAIEGLDEVVANLSARLLIDEYNDNVLVGVAVDGDLLVVL